MVEEVPDYDDLDMSSWANVDVDALLTADRRWSWRVSCWLGDLAVKIEPDVENRWWPQSWAAWFPATAAMVFDGYWVRRYVWHRWRAKRPDAPKEPSDV